MTLCRKKKLLALSLCTAMFTAILSACGGATGDVSEAESGGVVIIQVNDTDNSMKEYNLAMYEEFNNTVGKENNVRIEVTELDKDAIAIALENGTGPDIFSIKSLASYVENDYIVSLEDYPEFADVVASNNSFRQEGKNVLDGKLYSVAIGSRLYGLAYNKEMFKAAGLVDEKGEATPPKTYEQLREYAKILTNVDAQEYGIIYPAKWGSWYSCEIMSPTIASAGRNEYDVTTGKYDYSIYKPMIETILGMDDDGSVYPGADVLDNDPARARFAEGNIGMKFAVSWDVGVWNNQFPAGFDWGVAPVPVENADEVYYGINTPTLSGSVSKRGVEEKGADKIALVYEYIYGDDVQRELYERGYRIPWRADIVETAGEVKEGLVGWADFGEILKQSKELPLSHPVDTAAYDKDNADFLNKVWSRQYTADEWIAERNQIYNDGIGVYEKAYPDLDYSIYVNPDYERRLK